MEINFAYSPPARPSSLSQRIARLRALIASITQGDWSAVDTGLHVYRDDPAPLVADLRERLVWLEWEQSEQSASS